MMVKTDQEAYHMLERRTFLSEPLLCASSLKIMFLLTL